MTEAEAIGLIIAAVVLICASFWLGMRYKEITFFEDIAEVRMQRRIDDDY